MEQAVLSKSWKPIRSIRCHYESHSNNATKMNVKLTLLCVFISFHIARSVPISNEEDDNEDQAGTNNTSSHREARAANLGGAGCVYKHPYYVSLRSPINLQYCAGAMISPAYLLTAARCINEKRKTKAKKPVFGLVDLSTFVLGKDPSGSFPPKYPRGYGKRTGKVWPQGQFQMQWQSGEGSQFQYQGTGKGSQFQMQGQGAQGNGGPGGGGQTEEGGGQGGGTEGPVSDGGEGEVSVPEPAQTTSAPEPAETKPSWDVDLFETTWPEEETETDLPLGEFDEWYCYWSHIDQMTPHPDFDPESGTNDVGICKLDLPLKVGRFLQLPFKPFFGHLFNPSGGAYSRSTRSPCSRSAELVSWFGTDKCKRVGHASVATCNRVFKKRGFGASSMCTSPVGENVCHHETGAPLVCGNVLYGLVSLGKDCRRRSPGIFTRIDQQLPFIRGVMMRSASMGNRYTAAFLITLVPTIFVNIIGF
ncbi:unnamed protein product [Phaedon cochleariae]|uniref:Peptidase S1 domain-containing protein n=1 Tax=Phaedon cochleariae TaxID=80249 RepID=A0A9P0GQ15_PHACE|nr:unnamed protein product [Phaedon cochleariae]